MIAENLGPNGLICKQVFFKKMGQSRPLFWLFLFFSHYNFNINWKKHRWCAWDSNPGLQDGRHRRNHGAIANKFGHRFSFNLSSFHIATLYLVSKCYKTSRAFYHLSKYSEEDVYFWDKIIDHSHKSQPTTISTSPTIRTLTIYV